MRDENSEALSALAQAEGRPMVAIARELLSKALGQNCMSSENRVALSRTLRAELQGRDSDSADLIRSTRDARNARSS